MMELEGTTYLGLVYDFSPTTYRSAKIVLCALDLCVAVPDASLQTPSIYKIS